VRVAVVGCGYVGLVTAVGLAAAGHEVVGIEVADDRRERIAGGRAPFHEPGLDELLRETLENGTFRVSADMAAAAAADVVLLAVQTPPTPEGANDTVFLRRAAEDVAAAIAASEDPERRRVVVVRSTVVPGTAETVVRPVLPETVAVASNPEFLREGSAVADFRTPDRVVVGCHEPWGQELLHELYAPLGAEIVSTTPATAELAKYTSNAFLATLISFSNELARIAETLPGVDIEDVLGILHRDRRLSPRVDGRTIRPEILSYLRAGVGYGGSCLPKDLSALIASRGAETPPLLAAVRAINETQPAWVVERADTLVRGLAGRTVAVLGIAFKAGTDDLRESPGLRVVGLLLERGASVRVYDPLVEADALGDLVARGVTVAPSQADALAGAACCIVTTNAPEFDALSETVRAVDPPPLVVDGRRALDPTRFDGHYVAVGRSA
jgi:UDPglucose 6-dehydrogenase